MTRSEIKYKCNYARCKNGFTIVELMVVVVILGLLATTVMINVTGYLTKSRLERARIDIANLKNAIELFCVENHRYPSNEDGLGILLEKTPTHPGGIISQLPRDPWGRQYQYLYPGTHDLFDIYTLGRDGIEGGEGEDTDVCSWNLNEGDKHQQ